MKKLTNSFARIFVIIFFATTTLTSATFASVAPAAERPVKETSYSLVQKGDSYARHGESELALEHYSRSIRVGKLQNPDYADLATQDKIMTLIEQMNVRKTKRTIAKLILRGDDYATVQPAKALASYSLSIRVGKQRNDQYTDAATQQKIVDLVKLMGNR